MSKQAALAGRRVLVTGASSGIGRATAVLLVQKGAMVIATGRQQDALDRLKTEAGERLISEAGDLTDPSFIARLCERAGAVDVLVNAAGTLMHAPFLESDPADWQTVFDINIVALLRLTHRVAQDMATRRSGQIVNISSTLADQVYPFTMAYAATKHALRAISRGLRLELEPLGVRVIEIAPGFTETAIRRRIDHPAVLKNLAARGQAALPASVVADTVAFAIQAPLGALPELIVVRPIGQA